MFVVATAGHVDHGKSTLVRALTGMEPDRFAEERRRGMTIDLGYAWTTLPSGAEIAFVDVPGHQRFIANMLAGLGPVPALLVVVAADEGWSRQTAEHLAAADALRVRHAVLVVTRSDLADPGPVLADAAARLARTSLGRVPAVAVSGRTGAGLPELRAALDDLGAALPAPDTTAPVRLWVDRTFSVRGSGTVVTGTLAAGNVRVGDTLEIGGRPVAVRGLQTLGRAVDRATATARVALNLRGVGVDEVGRGAVLLTPGRWHRTDVVDVRTTIASGTPAQLMLHVGTASVPVHVRPLADGLVRLRLERALPLRAGDRAVLRDPGQQVVAGSVEVLDADPPALTRRGAARRRAEELATGTGAVEQVRRRGAVRRDHLLRLGIEVDAAPAVHDLGGWLVHEDTWRRWTDGAGRHVRAWAAGHPLQPAMPHPALLHALGLPDRALLSPVVAAAAGLSSSGGSVQTASTTDAITADLGPAERGVAELERRLGAAPFHAPTSEELAELGLGRRELAAAHRAGRLIRITEDIVLGPDAVERACDVLRGLPHPFTTSAARAALGTTRRVAIPLLEHLDRLGRTRRDDTQSRSLVQR